jgi:hypothetical protein
MRVAAQRARQRSQASIAQFAALQAQAPQRRRVDGDERGERSARSRAVLVAHGIA